MSEKKKKIRVELRKNRAKPPREKDFTRVYQESQEHAEDIQTTERVRAKGELSRYRTVVTEAGPEEEVPAVLPAVNPEQCVRGRVLRVHGLVSIVEADDGRMFRCAVRRLLKSLATEERNVVATGDIVWVRPATPGGGGANAAPDRHSPSAETLEGMIERVEPRHGVLTRASRRREHVLVANVDQLIIVMSLVQPDLKPHLIDRYLAAAQQGGLKPVLCLNKSDLADPVELQPLIGLYAQLGVPVVLCSARTGFGIDRLREQLRGRASVFSGQSGVGKSSLLNAIQPGLGLAVQSVSAVNQKGRHTTTFASLIKLNFGGWVVDTPGVRQLALWDTRPEEVEGYFPEFRPFVPLCTFPDCTHTHEKGCAVKDAVARRLITTQRYHSYLGLFHGTAEL
ncbi:MAG: ribosome small subunit-dependent GTPase A [Gemmataceae bacterium]|nr:ribosome small subunit-dependent GTPase A [Gemmata sp.]MDW8198847.1 ribosome small subunit-dependent GTPase A [Gemmataceae bacterium]